MSEILIKSKFYIFPRQFYRRSWNTRTTCRWDVRRKEKIQVKKKFLKSILEGGGGDNTIIVWCIFIASIESVLLSLNSVDLPVCEPDFGKSIPMNRTPRSSGWVETMNNNLFSYLWDWILLIHSI